MSVTTTPDLFDLGYVTASGGWDAGRGFFLPRPADFVAYATKAEAAQAARSIGWDAGTVERCHSRFVTRFYALHHPGGGFLTHAGLEAARAEYAAGHHTRTFQRIGETRPYNINTRGRVGYRPDVTVGWVCTCGNGGFGEGRDRASAQQRAKAHREDPVRYPGQPWTPGTVTRRARP